MNRNPYIARLDQLLAQGKISPSQYDREKKAMEKQWKEEQLLAEQNSKLNPA